MTGASPPSAPPRTVALLTAGLLLWAIGAQLAEALAVVGEVLTALGLLLDPGARAALRDPRGVLRAWAPLWAFLAVALLAPCLAGNWPRSVGVARLFDWAALPIVAAAFARLGTRPRRAIALAAAAVLLLSCASAALQYLGQWPSEAFFARVAWLRIPYYRMYEPIPGTTHFMGGGLLFHRLKFAHVSGLAVLWALALGLGGTRLRAGERALALGIAALGFVSVTVFPHARAATVALLLAALVVVVLSVANRRTALLAAGGLALAGAAVILLTPSLRARFLTSASAEGSGDRQAFLAAGLHAIAEHPLVGVGVGRFRPALYATGEIPAGMATHAGKAHNQVVSIAAESGIPAALLYGVLLVWLWRRMPAETPAGPAGRACLAFLVLLGLLHDPLFHAELSLALILALGAAGPRPAPAR